MNFSAGALYVFGYDSGRDVAVEFIATEIPGLCEIRPVSSSDDRGSFNKLFVADEFAAQGLATTFAEEYYTVSRHGVVRGMHFQLPPYDLSKIVCCISGTVFDVVVDLRTDSPAFGRAATFTLTESGNALYVPPGCAHGFATISERAHLLYKVTAPYSPEHDSGILWSSVDVEWPFGEPGLSPRDAQFVPLEVFDSPFRLDGEAGVRS